MSIALSRRGLLQAGSALGGGLLVRLSLGEAQAAGSAALIAFRPNAWLLIDDERAVFTVASAEMGQGVSTALPTLLCEELDLDPRRLQLVLAGADRAFENPEMGLQITGGSMSIKAFWEPLRMAGAIAREMLKTAAARAWSVPVSEVVACEGEVSHPSGRRATYHQLAKSAGSISVPTPSLKPAKQFKWIGQPLPRLDLQEKIDGSGIFGIDVKVPNLRIGVVVRCPVFGGKVKSYDPASVQGLPGVENVVNLQTGVGIVARTYWHAREAADQLKVEWDEGPLAQLSSDGIRERYREKIARGGARVAAERGDPDEVLLAKTRLCAVYEAPYLAHAPMEPINATASVTDEGCEIWVPSQAPGIAKLVASDLTGLSMDRVKVNTTLLGGGFGRRASSDFVAEAVRLSKEVRKPVKVVWSREDDLRHGQFRAYSYHQLEGALDPQGGLVGWVHKIAAQSMLQQVSHEWVCGYLPDGMPSPLRSALAGTASALLETMVDATSVEGAADTEYAVPHLKVEWYPDEPGVPLAPWRSVGHSFNAFVVESFVDELAHAAKVDPFEFRRRLLKLAHRSRWVLEQVAQKAGWTSAPPPGVFRGIAQHRSFGSHTAAVAEVGVEEKRIRVQRVVIAIDCGQVVNPDIVAAQLEGATLFGLTAALKGKITFSKGRVEQSNFHDYELVRMSESPKIETYVVSNQAPPTGCGEPGVPVIAPAVANAVFAATGKRLRVLPLSLA